MTRSRHSLLLVGMLVSACAVSHVVPKPDHREASGLAIDVRVKAPIGIFSSKAQIVYFVRLDGAAGLQRSTVIPSTMAISGRAYLLNVPAGEYAAVAAAETQYRSQAAPSVGLSITGPDTRRTTTFFSNEVVESTRVTVEPGQIALMGRLVVDTSVGFDGADSTQLHYAGLLAPGAATSTMGQIFSPGSYQYLGTLGEIQRDEETLSEFRESAAQDLAEGGWSEILATTGSSASARTAERPSGSDVVYAVCTDAQTKKFEMQGQGDQSEAMAHLLCRIAADGCKENPDQEGCKNTLRELDAHLKASESSMLFEASRSGQAEIVKAMIALGSDPNVPVAGGWTPLLMAAAEGNGGTVTALLDAKADPNLSNDLGRSPLMFASSKGFTAIVKDLLARGADPNAAPTDAQGWTALMVAARAGHVETVEALLSGGAEVRLTDKGGNTALALADAQGHSAVARALKQHDRGQ